MRFIYLFVLSLVSMNTWSADAACSPQGDFRKTYGCMPVVFVIRHAEDTQAGHHDLTDVGQKHAELYIQLFQNYIWGNTHSVGKNKAQACVCPLGKIISISNIGGNVLPPNPNSNPSPNPYKTVVKLSEKGNIPIQTDNGIKQYWSSFQWTAEEKLKLFDNIGNTAPFSVVISWDKQGLNPTKEEYDGLMRWLKPPESHIPFHGFIPLLQSFPNTPFNQDSIALVPLRTHLWVFSDQNEQGKFINVRFYQQIFYAKDCHSNPSFTPTTYSECIVPQQRSF